VKFENTVQQPGKNNAHAAGIRTPPFLKGLTDKHHRLNEYIIPFSHANLNQVNKIANWYSNFFRNIVFYTHNNFEIRILEEIGNDSTGEMEMEIEIEIEMEKQHIERLFVQFAAVYQAAESMGRELDFIRFDKFRVLPGYRLQFPPAFPGKKETNPTHLEHALNRFNRNRHFKDLNLDKKNFRDIFNRLKNKYTFPANRAYIYRYDDFASDILNAYPLAELKSDTNLKIKIKTGSPIPKKIIKLNLYNNHISQCEDIFFADLRAGCPSHPVSGHLPYLLDALLPQKGKPGGRGDKDDFVAIIQRLNLFLKKSSFKSMVLMVDHLTGKEDAGFINYLLDSAGIGNIDVNIVLVCFDPDGDLIDFDLELNEKPANLLGKYLGLAADTGDKRINKKYEPGKTQTGTQETPGMDIHQVEHSAALLLDQLQLDAARELIFNSNRQSAALKLTLAEIYHWEKENQKLVRLLKEIKEDLNGSKTIPKKVNDQYHYLEFIHLEKESRTEQADRHLKKIKGNPYAARASVQLSDRYIYKGDYNRAENLLEESIDWLSKNGPLSGEIEAGTQLAKLYREQKAFKKAEKLYQNLFIKSEMKNYRLLAANISVDLGNLYLVQDNFNQAEVWYKKALKIYRDQQNQNGIYLVTSNLVDIDKVKGNWQECKTSLESILAYDKQKNAVTSTAIDYFNIAHLEYLKHNFAGAREFLETAVSLFEKKNSITHLADCEILKQKLALMSKAHTVTTPGSGEINEIDTDFLKRLYQRLTDDHKAVADIFAGIKNDPLNPGSPSIAAVIDKVSRIKSKREQYEIIAAIIPHYKGVELLGLLKSLSMVLTAAKDRKNYYYYEYYYIYYNYFFNQGRGQRGAAGNDENETGRFHDMYDFFRGNQRHIAANSGIGQYKQLLDQESSRYDIFKSAELVGDYVHWKIPEDFFNSLVNEIRKIFADDIELVKLVIYESKDKPLFCFSTSAAGKFAALTDEIITAVSVTMEPLNLGPEEIKQYTSSEKAFYFYKNTRAFFWKIAEELFGVLLLAFSRSEYRDYDFYRRHEGLLKKFGSLIYRYYENDYKRDRKLDFIIGGSPAVKRLKETILKVGKQDFWVLITGESGSGKELVAKAVHLLSGRSAKAFIPVNAAAIPENLLEAELFGYKKGAFTGANESKPGLIEEADGGTLFLDEIADLPILLQAKLLRVLQENEIRRLGENKNRAVNIRLICATNRNLKELIAARQFREDLYYRIQDLTIAVPPLRQRPEDIPLLVRHFLKKYGFTPPDKHELQRIIEYFSGQVREWTGNIRELESNIKRLITYYPDFDMEPFSSGRGSAPGPGLVAARENLERSMIRRALSENDWNKVDAASALKISRQYLFTLMNKYGITSPRPPPAGGV
jgi:transcriptional regulator with PAS, ATPase and Fis domain/Tfp pilus assembly protein PilF